jgi:hypothetical protein
MGFSESVERITIDGQAIVQIKVGAGALTSVGLITDVTFDATAIKREFTKGTAAIGYDGVVKFKMVQTTQYDWSQIVDSRTAAQLKIIGAINTITVDNMYLAPELALKFNNKSESYIQVEGMIPGATPTISKSWLVSTGVS